MIDKVQREQNGEQVEFDKAMQKQFQIQLEEEDIKRRKRAKQHWLKEGDRNTQFFHLQENQRRKNNKISHILNNESKLVVDQSQLGELFSKFYSDIFTSSLPHRIEECLQAVLRRLSEEVSQELSAPFTKQEINDALFQMNAFGAPRPDGFPAHFYQKIWSTIHMDICSYILNFLNNSAHLDDINSTFIVLKPKVKEAKRMWDYRPISLCNVIYKLVVKVIANRIKPILAQIISPNQSAFIPV